MDKKIDQGEYSDNNHSVLNEGSEIQIKYSATQAKLDNRKRCMQNFRNEILNIYKKTSLIYGRSHYSRRKSTGKFIQKSVAEMYD